MTASEPLTGTDVIDCAKASAEQGVEAAARSAVTVRMSLVSNKNSSRLVTKLTLRLKS